MTTTTPNSRKPPAERSILTPLQEKKQNPKLKILKDSSLESFCEYLKTKNPKNLIILTGAGISTSAGIPDFRTKGSGLYDNLLK